MNAHLLSADRDFDLAAPLPWGHEALVQDLQLEPLLEVMASGDPLLARAARQGLLGAAAAADPATIRYRQRAWADCCAEPAAVQKWHALARDGAQAARRERAGLFTRRADSIAHASRRALSILVATLAEIRSVADAHPTQFTSPAFGGLATRLQEDLSDDYLADVTGLLHALQFPGGVTISAGLGPGLQSREPVLRGPRPSMHGWALRRLRRRQAASSFVLHPRDDAGHRLLGEWQNRGLEGTARALAQSVDHIIGFLQTLEAETGFYLAALNLQRALAEKGPLSIPEPRPLGTSHLAARGVWDPSLALQQAGSLVPNSVPAGAANPIVITGANRGGKSTLLRALGICQLLMQAGLFVPAEHFSASVAIGILTHFKREEDRALARGKLDEELARLRDILDHLRPHALVLANEPMQSTNEAEGAAIGGQLFRALVDSKVRVLLVTHLHDLAVSLTKDCPSALSLRAGPPDGPDGPFVIQPGDPKPTAYAEGLYRALLGNGDGRGDGDVLQTSAPQPDMLGQDFAAAAAPETRTSAGSNIQHAPGSLDRAPIWHEAE